MWYYNNYSGTPLSPASPPSQTSTPCTLRVPLTQYVSSVLHETWKPPYLAAASGWTMPWWQGTHITILLSFNKIPNPRIQRAAAVILRASRINRFTKSHLPASVWFPLLSWPLRPRNGCYAECNVSSFRTTADWIIGFFTMTHQP
jgi:hypothetical protein